MDSKLTNLKTLHTNRWQQDDTPCFVPFPNQSLKYWITTLLVAMMSIVGVWATDVTFDVKNGNASQYNDKPYLGQVVNVTLTNRTFTAGEWQGVCFPFSANKAQLDATFGENGYTIEEFSSFDGSKISFSIMQEPSVVAGTPYIIKVKTTVENPVFNGVTFASSVTDNWTDLDIGHNFSFRGYYFNKYNYQFVEGQSSEDYNAYWILSGGTLGNYRSNTLPYKDGGYVGARAFFFTSTKGKAALTLSLEYPSGDSGEGGDDPVVDPTSLDYKIANKQQLTDVPTIYLTIPDVNNIDEDLKQVEDPETGDTKYFRATIQVVDNSEAGTPQHLESFTESGLSIKVRGNSTALPGGGKRPYRLKFDKDEKDPVTGKKIATHKHDMLGLGYSKRNWTLLANAFDKSMMRNAVTYHLGKYFGFDFCPGYKFVDLVINNEYRGTYQVSDQVEVDKNRINIDEDNDWFLEFCNWATQTEEPCITSGTTLMVNIKNPEPAATEGTTDEEIAASLEANTTALKNEVKAWENKWAASFENFSKFTGWQAYNDVESFIKFYLAINITADYDGWFVFKGYRTPTGPFYWGPLWDKDLAYGNCEYDPAESKLVEYYGKSNFDLKIQGLQNDIEFVSRAKTLMDQMTENDYLYNKLHADIENMRTTIDKTQALNYTVWGLNTKYGIESQYQASTYDSYSDYVDQLDAYIRSRITFVKGKIDDMYNALNVALTDYNYNPQQTNSQESDYFKLWPINQAKKNINVTVSPREAITGSHWSTIFFPFEMTEAQMKAALGNQDYDLREFAGVEGSEFRFTIPDTKDIYAEHPYLIKLKNSSATTGTSLTFSGVYVASSDDNPVEFGDGDYKIRGVFHVYGATGNSNEYKLNDNNEIVVIPAPSWISGSSDGANNIYGTNFHFISKAGVTPTIYIEPDATPVVRTQLTTLPTIYIDTQDGAAIQPSSGEWVAAGIQVIDAKGNLKPFTQEIGLTSAGKNILQIRGRGTVSWTGTNKKSYRLQFGKDDKDDLGNVTKSYKHNLLKNEDGAGVVKKRNWVLLANSGDKTLVRNALTKEIGDAVGLPFTPGYRFVDLVLNGTYVGTYQVTEFLEADANRVNIDEDNGLLIQMTGSSDVATGDHVISGEDYTKPYLTIKNPEVKKAKQLDWNAAFNTDTYNFDAMWDATDGTGLDKESLVNWYIASEIIGDYEALSSIYAYKDFDDTELSFGPLWGTETAYDNNASITMTSAGLMSDLEENSTHTGLMTKAGKQSAWQTKIEGLWAQPWFANAVRLRWNTLYNNGALTTTLKDKVTTLAGIVNATDGTFTTSSQAKNFTATADGGAGWSIEGQGITSYSKNVANNATYETEIARLKTYIETRLPYLDKKFKALDKTIEYDVTRSDAISAYSIYNGQTANVTLKNRGTIWGGEWNAICLPFSLTNEQLIAVFGTGYQLKSFKGVTEGETFNTFDFNDTQTTLDAGVPYIIKPTANVTNLTFNNVTLNLSEDKSVVEKTSDKSNTFKFTGTLQPYKMADDGTDWFIGRNNKAYKSNGTLHACRAYFTMPSTQAAAKAFMFGNLITSIDNIVINDNSLENVKIYNLNGQVVGNSWNAVPQGIYIVNGKKVIK